MTIRRLLLLLAVVGCDDDGGSPTTPIDPADVALDGAPLDDGAAPLDMAAAVDDGGVDAPDAAPPDAALEPDAAPTGGFCQPCGFLGCHDDGVCVQDPQGNDYCTTTCVGDQGCPGGARCGLRNGQRRCVPPQERCDGWFGRDCGGDDDCNGSARTCAGGGYCTIDCAGDHECPVGFGRCREGTCRADTELTPSGCGRGGPLPGCGDGCPGDDVCATDLLDTLPEAVGPFCTRACEADADCPEASRCRAVGEVRLCLDAACACVARPVEATLLDEALALAGLDRCTAGFDAALLDQFPPDISRDPFRLAFFNPAHLNAVGGYEWAQRTRARLHAEASGEQPVTALLGTGAWIVDQPAALPGGGAELDVLDALRATYQGAQGFDREASEAALAGVPEALQSAVARILSAALAVVEARRADLAAAAADPDIAGALFELGPTTLVTHPDFTGLNMTHPEVRRLLSGDLRLPRMFAAARRLAQVVEQTDWDALTGAEGFEVSLETPLGRVILNDAGAQTVSGDEQVLLLVDTGGDDHYEAPIAATHRFQRPVSVAIDLAGDDRYGYPGDDAEPDLAGGLPPPDAAGRYDGSHPQVADQYGPISRSMVPRQGAGVLGVGLLFDLAGDDVYRSLRVSQGASVLGVGVLYDGGGRDEYACEQGCQGASSYGVGLLLDQGGDDTYAGAQSVQGYAYVRAFGYLHDAGGDDVYVAVQGDAERGGVHLYPNAQNPGRSNTSLAQGAGFGRRADFSDGVFASGGLGVLRDAGEGADRYTVDIFGQGTGFWYGTGIFSDGGGDDVYSGRWYNQGSGAHFAMSYFFEEGGDDVYNPNGEILATAVGQGHDFTLGWLVDSGGNDTYSAPGLGMGAGNDNGIGFFLDLGGDDTYDAPDGRTFGGAGIGNPDGLRARALCIGIFVDAGGVDAYPRFEAADALIGDDRRWSLDDRRPDHHAAERGAGIDANDGALSLP